MRTRLQDRLARMRDTVSHQETSTKRRLGNQDWTSVNLFAFSLGLGIVLAILVTFPAVCYLDTHIMGYPHDGFEYIWKQWWTRTALLELHSSPSSLEFVNYPYAGQNPHIVASPLLNLLALPFIKWLGGLRTYNLLMLASFALSWPTASLLCHEFCQDSRACLVGGAVYAFFSNKVAHAVGGHLPQMSVFLFPVAALFLYRTLKAPPSYKNAVVAGIFIGLSALVDLKHIGLFVAPVVGVFVLYHGIAEGRQWNRTRIGSLVTAFAVAAAVTLPLLLPVVTSRIAGDLDHFFVPGVIQHSADLTSFLVPPPEHPLYSRIEAIRSYSSYLAKDGWHENIFYIGIVTLSLSTMAIIRSRRRQDLRFWTVVAVTGIILSLGPVLKVGGAPVELEIRGHEFSFPLPYSLLQHIPFYDWCRTPGSSIGVAMLALAVLAACGSEIILRPFTRTGRVAVGWLTLLLVLVDSLFIWPWPMGDAEVPVFYEQLAADHGDYAILDLPLWEYRCERYQIYYATIHEHPIVGGLITRRSAEAEQSMRAIEAIVEPGALSPAADSLRDLGIRYVVLHKLCLDEETLEVQSRHLQAELSHAVYEDNWIRAFLVPRSPTIDRDGS